MGRGKHLSTKKKEMRGLMSAMKEGLADGDVKAAKKKYKGKNLQYIILSKFDDQSISLVAWHLWVRWVTCR